MLHSFFYLLMLICLPVVRSNHFYGGTVTWKPVNKTAMVTPVAVMFTQSYQWRRTQTHCDRSYIGNQTVKIPRSNKALQCVTPPSTCDNYTALSVNGFCTDFSSLLDTSSSQASDVQEISMDGNFCVAYRDLTWPGIISPSCGFDCYLDNARWSIGCCVDLEPRIDGLINSAPAATVISPIRVAKNTQTKIVIPVIDADNDVLRYSCRWATNSSTFDECGDICGMVSGSTLDEETCTLTFDSVGKQPGDYYAVALMVEDFYNETNSSALSSVSVQFLVHIVDESVCPTKPVISSNVSSNTIVTVGTEYAFTLTIQSMCPNVSIVDFFRSPLLNMRKGNLTVDGANNRSIIIERWTPTEDQLGSQIYCAVATDSASIQSDFYCLTFTVVPLDSIDPIGNGSSITSGPWDDHSYSTDHLTSVTSTEPAEWTSEELTTLTTSTTTSTSTSTSTTTTTSTSTSDTSTSTTSATTTTTSTSTTTSVTTATTTTATTSTTTTTATTSTTSTSTTSTTTSTTTTTTQVSVTVIVTVPVTTKDNSGLLGLGLGLGIPLGLAFVALTAYGVARGRGMVFGAKSNLQLSNRTDISTDQISSIEKQMDTDVRRHEQISTIKETTVHTQTLSTTNEQSITSTTSATTTMKEAQPLLPKENSISSIFTSEAERNGSVLVNAFSLQEKFSTVHQLA